MAGILPIRRETLSNQSINLYFIRFWCFIPLPSEIFPLHPWPEATVRETPEAEGPSPLRNNKTPALHRQAGQQKWCKICVQEQLFNSYFILYMYMYLYAHVHVIESIY